MSRTVIDAGGGSGGAQAWITLDGGGATARGFIEHRDGGGHLPFYYNPEEINTRSAAAWVAHPIVGIADPRLQYAGGEGQRIDFTLQLLPHPEYGPLDVDESIRWLESLVFPDIAASSLAHREAPRVRVFFGASRGVYYCVVEQVDVIQRRFFHDLRTRYAEVELRLLVDRVRARGWQEVRATRGSGSG